MPKLHGTTNTSDKTALVAWCRQRPTRMWQGAASGWHALTPMNSKSMVGCDGSHPSTQAHNDSGNCPGVCSVRNQSKSARRFLCVVPDALLPEANFLCPTLVENKSVGLGKYFDKVMSDAAACRNGSATEMVVCDGRTLAVRSLTAGRRLAPMGRVGGCICCCSLASM